MDNGAGPQGPGSIGATWELDYGAWPPQAGARRRGTSSARTARSARSPPRHAPPRYTADPGARPKQTLPGNGADDAWKAQPPYNWAPRRGRQGPRVRVERARQGRRDRRPVEPRHLPQVVRARHRPPGHAQRGAPRRQRDLRAERLAARLAPQARPQALDRPRPVPDAPEEGRGAAAEAAATCSCACRSSRWRTRSAPARGSG